MNEAAAAERRLGLAWWCCRAALFTLPWIGLGVMTLTTGRDLGAGLQVSWVLMAAAVLLSLPELVRGLGETRRSLLIALGPFTLALLLSALGLFIAPADEPLTGAFWRLAKQLVQFEVMLAFVLVPAWFLRRGRALADLATPLVCGALFQAGYAVLQAVHFYHPLGLMALAERVFTSNPAIFAGSEQLYLGDALQEIPRLRGTACEPLYLGNYLLLAVPLAGLTRWPRRWRLATTLVLLAVLGGTWSRGAWLGVVCGGAVALGLAPALGWQVTRRGVLRAVGLGVLVLAAAAALAALTGRTEFWLPGRRLLQSFSTVDWSNLTRLYSMQAAWRAFLLSPLVGIGWGQFGFHYAALADPMGLQAMFTWPVVNNFYLMVLCETGLLGCGAGLWAVARLGRTLRRRLRVLPLADRRGPALVLIATAAVWFQLLTFSQYNLPHLWVPLGLLAGLAARAEVAP